MTAPTMFDTDLIDAARDLKYTNRAEWDRFLLDHPELAAEASKPRLSKDAHTTGSPEGCEPYRCWHHTDRGRHRRRRGAGSGDTDTDDFDHVQTSASVEQQWFGTAEGPAGSLLDLHTSVGADGYGVTPVVISPQHQLEVCRLCGAPLDLPRDADGFVIRAPEGQPEYCSPRCKATVKNARGRAKYAALNPRPVRRRKRPVDWQAMRADRIARRFGTGGTPGAPPNAWCQMPGWDRVTTFWRFTPRQQHRPFAVEMGDGGWRIAEA